MNDDTQLVSDKRLLEILFQESCRPTTRWLRDQRKAKRISHVRIGGRVFYSPAKVRAELDAKLTVKARNN